MPIALARIRRAAQTLAAAKKPVDLYGLALRLREAPKEIEEYLKGVTGLAKEIGFCHEGEAGEKTTEELFVQAAQELCHRNKPVTVVGLANELLRDPISVRKTLQRFPHLVETLGIVDAVTARVQQRCERYTRAARALRSTGEQVTVPNIAAYCGIEVAAVQFDKYRLPAFFTELLGRSSQEKATS